MKNKLNIIITISLIISIGLLFLYLYLPIVSFFVNYYNIKKQKEINNDFLILNNISKQNKNNKRKNIIIKVKINDKNIKKYNQNRTGNQNLLEYFYTYNFLRNIKYIYIWQNIEKVIYKDINQNIQKDLWNKSVISFRLWKPIIFSHSSWWKYNFWLYYLFLNESDIIFFKSIYQDFQIIYQWKVIDIYDNIPWNKLAENLEKIVNRYKNKKIIILDTCELNWTKRRILVVELNNVFIQ